MQVLAALYPGNIECSSIALCIKVFLFVCLFVCFSLRHPTQTLKKKNHFKGFCSLAGYTERNVFTAVL